MAQSNKLADALKEMPSQTIQDIARTLGFDAAMRVVGEMLFALLPEQAVVVALDVLQAEQCRLIAAEKAT